MTSKRPVAIYRNLLRAVKSTFGGDARALSGAKAEIRQHYQASACLEDAAAIDNLCDAAEDAAQFMRTDIVQAKLNERGNYAMQVEDEHLDAHGQVVANAPDDVLKEKDKLGR